MKVRLEVAKSKANVKRVVLTRDTTIGRAPECNLRIASGQVSRKHCEVLVGDNGVFVRDLGSSNGTFVGEQKLEPYEETPVPPGSTLSVGGVRFRVRYELADSLADAGGSTVNVPRPDAGAAANDTVRDDEEKKPAAVEPQEADAPEAEAIDTVEAVVPDFEATETFVPEEDDVPVFDAEFDDGFAAVADDEVTIDENVESLGLVDVEEVVGEEVVGEESEPEPEKKSKGLFGWGKKKSKKSEKPEPEPAAEKPAEETVALAESSPAELEETVKMDALPEAEETVKFDFGDEEESDDESGDLANFLQNLD